MRTSSRGGLGPFLLLMVLAFSLLPFGAFAAEVEVPDVKLSGGVIYVSATLELDEALKATIHRGIQKEVTFYIDLFRVWRNWPDEFVAGRKIVRTIKCDPVKKEYVATSYDGATLLEKRFTACEHLLSWTNGIGALKLTNVSELEPSDYFIKVTVESSRKSVPRFIAHLFFFLPKKEFNTSKKSEIFAIGDER